ncbi:ABC transporter family substrate-binding protein [Microbacterium horticulturae]|uniref:ABC transporter family substrate-binding protein n=1 Tax=Microbacterium horticulturae TaxID=3028316 RepID=A0ABY8BTM4_9MICO|nr:ABC transporter family substrate-binding protein [Microbacterium sp. KACC 23027]WEG07529.1 ABC transporter family substrate-binding protein [Microbacterium sp. KACC 23027]
MNRRTTALAAVAVLGATGLALAGCAQPNATPTNTKSEAAQLPLVGWTDVPASQLQQGGTLNLAVLSSGTDEGNWNISTTQGANVPVVNMQAPIMGTPYKATKDGGVEPDPNYATSIELTSKDPQTVDVKLNDKAVWEDGTPLTANDYKATFAALSGKNDKFNIASSAGFDQVSSFDVKSDYEFTFTFSSPYADWQALLTTPAVPKAIASDPDKWASFTTKPLPSSGPFVMSKIDNNAKVYTETPNPNWWGEKPKLDKITWTVIDQGSQAQAFSNNEINAVEVQDVDTYTAALKKSGAKALNSGGLTYSQITFNGLQAPLDDVNVRKAIAQAVDRELMAKTANEPLGVQATTMGDWLFMPGQKGYTDTMGEKLPYDLDAAKKSLETAGWTNADGKWTKDGKTLKLSVIIPQGTKSNELRAQQIQASLKKIDIDVTLDPVPSADYFTNIMAGKYEMATFGWQGTLFPISSSESLFYPEMKPGGDGQNFAFVTDEKLGDLWSQANSELDQSKRLKIAQQINEVIAGYMPMLPIYPYPNVTVVDKNLANYGPSTFMSVDWTKVGFTE